MKTKIIFLGTTDFAAHQLQAMHQSKDYEVVMVVSQPDRKAGRDMKLKQSSVKQYAIKNNLHIITPEKMNLALNEIKNLNAQAAVVVAYGQILSQDFLDLYPKKVVNLHASLLPRWRGAAPIQRAIMAGDKITGVSLQVMVKQLDAGDIIGEKKIEIENNLNSIELHEKLKYLAPKLLLEDLKNYLNSTETINLIKQNQKLVTYANKIEKSEQKINWNLSAQDIHNFIRGLALNKGSSCDFKNNKEVLVCKIHKTEICSMPTNVDKNILQGCVTNIDKESFSVACGPDKNNLTYLKILELQLPSRPKIKAKEFIRQNPEIKFL
ncbi:MAG: methionyl-tRNA formyltransferase [Bdellovibrionales bacterium]|nr:methionyl-tRNA formyltransferase [Bdellovibrionales bacterium]